MPWIWTVYKLSNENPYREVSLNLYFTHLCSFICIRVPISHCHVFSIYLAHFTFLKVIYYHIYLFIIK